MRYHRLGVVPFIGVLLAFGLNARAGEITSPGSTDSMGPTAAEIVDSVTHGGPHFSSCIIGYRAFHCGMSPQEFVDHGCRISCRTIARCSGAVCRGNSYRGSSCSCS